VCSLMWNVTIRCSRKRTLVGIYQLYDFSQNKICKSERNTIVWFFWHIDPGLQLCRGAVNVVASMNIKYWNYTLWTILIATGSIPINCEVDFLQTRPFLGRIQKNKEFNLMFRECCLWWQTKLQKINYTKVFSGDQSCKYWFTDILRLHH
jgi:hypothetical protein